LKEIIAMTADASIDPARFLSEQLDRAAPDLLRSLLNLTWLTIGT
jgi:hypothetical protein